MSGSKAQKLPVAKSQKTLNHFFKKQTEVHNSVVRITCPACNSEVPESKINWHLDQDCKSRLKAKKSPEKKTIKKKSTFKLEKKDPVNEDIKKNDPVAEDVQEHNRNGTAIDVILEPDTRLVLSCVASDSDIQEIDREDIQEIDHEEDMGEESLVLSQMVETVLFELDDEISFKTPVKEDNPSPCDTNARPSCSRFMLESESTSQLPPRKSDACDGQRVELKNSTGTASKFVSENQESKESSSVSRCLSAVSTKAESAACDVQIVEREGVNFSKFDYENKKADKRSDECASGSGYTSLVSTPTRLSLKRKISSVGSDLQSSDELADLESSLYTNTKDISKIYKEDAKEKVSCTKNAAKTAIVPPVSPSLRCDNDLVDSGDEFEANPIQFKTPEKPLRKRLKSLSRSSKKSRDEADLSSSSSSNDAESFVTPMQSPPIVLPTSPNISDKDSSVISSTHKSPPNVCVRQLFTPPNSPSKIMDSSAEPMASTSKIKLSPSLKNNPNRYSNVEKILTSGLDVLNAPNTSSSTENPVPLPHDQKSPKKSPKQQPKISIRSPRKINMSIKATGLLQSSQNVSGIIFKRKSISLSPDGKGKLQTSDQVHSETFKGDGTPDKANSQGISGKPDKSRFRTFKGYYLDNFLLILEAVMSEPSDVQLFNEEDLSVVHTFHDLTLAAQKLYVRLFQRKMKWNRVSKIVYDDICDQEDMEMFVRELSSIGFLLTETELSDQSEILQMLSAEELKGLCKELKLPVKGSKDVLLKELQKLNKQQCSVMATFSKKSNGESVITKKARELMGRSCLVNKGPREVFMRIFMLYGLPRFDDEENTSFALKTLLMVNMGKMLFPKYEVVRHHSIFRSRDDVIRYSSCSHILSDVNECLENHKWEEALSLCNVAKDTYLELLDDTQLIDHEMSLPRFLRHYTAISVLLYTIGCSVDCFQRLKKYQMAVRQLEFLLNQGTHLQDFRGRWYDRLALNLEMHMKSPKALQVIQEALKDPEVREGHRLSLSMRAEKMAASTRFKFFAPEIHQLELMNPREAPKIIIEGRQFPGDTGRKSVFIREDTDWRAGEGVTTMCSVEELVLEYFKDLGFCDGLHREGTTVNSLFALFFWDILYSPVPDVFRSPYQASPLDLDDPHFYSSRKEIIEERLSQIQGWNDEEAFEAVERIWTEHIGEICMVAWDVFRNLDYTKGLIASLTLPVLARIFRRLALDHRFTRSGFPDLIVWNPVQKKHCIVEVKGPGDRLSTKQILWLDYLLENGARAEVCHVEAVGTKKLKLAPARRISPKKKETKVIKEKTESSDMLEMQTKSKRGRKKGTKNKQNQGVQGDNTEIENGQVNSVASHSKTVNKRVLEERTKKEIVRTSKRQAMSKTSNAGQSGNRQTRGTVKETENYAKDDGKSKLSKRQRGAKKRGCDDDCDFQPSAKFKQK